jgi:16S rRNA (guanine527-N7)-methyltransferase
VDSIMLNVFLGLEWKVADLWTGWGFPLVPLAITNPNTEFIWIDSVWKKLKAIDEFALNLNLKNIKTLNWRAEEIWQNLEYRENFDFVVSRATAFLPTLLEYAIPLLKIWWIFVAYKLDDKEELKSGKKALEKLWSKILKVKNYSLASQERTLVFIEKLEKTNIKYPRKIWIPLAKPI